jgi:UDPglucose 6-dehydrogenase
MGMDKRIGNKFLHAGPGLRRLLFPQGHAGVDTYGAGARRSSRIVESVVEVNASQKARMVAKIREALGGSEADKTIAVLGLTFKPETDDMRDAPALAILPALADKGALICAHDPEGMQEARGLLPETIELRGQHRRSGSRGGCRGAHDRVEPVSRPRPQELGASMRGNVFVDLRNVYERQLMERAGFAYTCVGR